MAAAHDGAGDVALAPEGGGVEGVGPGVGLLADGGGEVGRFAADREEAAPVRAAGEGEEGVGLEAAVEVVALVAEAREAPAEEGAVGVLALLLLHDGDVALLAADHRALRLF